MPHPTRNILFLNSIESGVWGGLEHWMEINGLGLIARGHRVWYAGREGSQFLKRISAHAGAAIVPMEFSGDFNPFTIRTIAQFTRNNKIDIICCNFVKDVRLAGLARILADDFRIVWTPGVNLARKSFSHKWLFAGFVDRAIVPSVHLKDAIISSGYVAAEKFEVIPIGIDPEKWRSDREAGQTFLRERFDLPEDAFVCLTSGRFVPQKGHCYLVSAAKALAEKHDNIFFLFLGDGPLQPTILTQIKSLGLTDRFVFCGMLRNHCTAVFGADLYVHPAIVEPYGIVLVEAMAAGLPIVATRVGGIPEVVSEDETALLVDPADPEKLTTAIERMYNDKTLREAYGRAGFGRFEKRFQMETMIDRVEQVLIEVNG